MFVSVWVCLSVYGLCECVVCVYEFVCGVFVSVCGCVCGCVCVSVCGVCVFVSVYMCVVCVILCEDVCVWGVRMCV